MIEKAVQPESESIVFQPLPKNKRFRDLTGFVSSELTVIGYNGHTDHGYYKIHYWLCRCSCGKVVSIAGSNLIADRCRSCGCKKSEYIGDGHRTHGRSKTSEHNIWCAMRRRCGDKSNARYSRYGGRGITVCERWASSFENFFEDMGPRPSRHHSIDRINNDGNYEPSNCRWATQLVQCHNSSVSTNLTHNGETKCIKDWAAHAGISSKSMYTRLANGWSIEKAISTPIRKSTRDYKTHPCRPKKPSA